MSCVYLYDGSFQGLLTALQAARERGEEPAGIRPGGGAFQESLLSEALSVKTDPSRVERISSDICSGISRRSFRHAFHAFLSEQRDREPLIHAYLRLGWELGPDLDACLGDEAVHAVHRMSRATGLEAHRVRGFLRFRELREGRLYAPMRPECDVLCLVAPHFHRRMPDEEWMIHDLAREQAAICARGELRFGEAPGFDPELTEREARYQGMWREYFETIAVRERFNPALQRSFMPAKYWNMLVEFPAGSHL